MNQVYESDNTADNNIERLQDLYEELEYVYEHVGPRGLFALGHRAALARQVDEVLHLCYVVYTVGREYEDDYVIASAVAQYAAAALRDDENPTSIKDEQRCAYIAIRTLQDFLALDDDGGLNALDDEDDAERLSFPVRTLTLSTVRGSFDGAQ